jgi:acetylornithine deacetylase/succinyl-diaminopimelate desuccinylase-like protein
MPAQTSDLAGLLSFLERDEDAAVDRLIEWLRIPSVGTDPAHNKDTLRAAEWLCDQFRAVGIEAELRSTGTDEKPGHPIVWAEHPGDNDYRGPHVLFYGHYDVQPADPVELWDSGPFEPVVKDADSPGDPSKPGKRIVARGACDDKGQVATFLEACRAWKETHGSVPIRVTVMVEGEEESGSANLEKFVADHAEHLKKCDICVISDTGMLDRKTPAITAGVRGIVATQVTLHGPNQDLHSGAWGGRVPNPLNELTRMLGQLWGEGRRITIPGFYDEVVDPTPEDRERWAKVAGDGTAGFEAIGLPPEADVGEAGFTALEREWARPTAEINGITGGYTGDGFKTVIPTKASAKVSFRLVANQSHTDILKRFRAWLESRLTPGLRLELTDFGGGYPGNVSSDSPYVQAALRAMSAVHDGNEPVLIRTGGSIPVVGLLKEQLDLDTLLVGFGLDDDRVHSPNEKFELSCFNLGRRTHAALMGEFAAM